MKFKTTTLTLMLGIGLTLLALVMAQPSSGATSKNTPQATERRVCVTCTYTTVQAAVDAADPGDTVKVAAGTYQDIHERNGTTQTVYISKSLSLLGGYTPADWGHADPDANVTTLDPQGKGHAIYVTNEIFGGEPLHITLDGLRIVNGAAEHGGGVHAEGYNGVRLTVRRCAFQGNVAFGSGGGLYAMQGHLHLETSHFTQNYASGGAGAYARESTVTMTHNTFEDNTADRWGGGADLYECQSSVTHNTFDTNASGESGGGLAASYGILYLAHNTLVDNVAEGYGGGLHTGGLNAGDIHTITHNRFEGNVADPSESGAGGGLYLSSGEGRVTITHNEVLNNIATQCRMQWSKGRGGGIYLYTQAPALIAHNLIQGNWAATDYDCTGQGGGVLFQGPVWLEANRILDNRASRYPDWGGYFKVYGGGVYISHQSHATMTNNIIAGNRHYEEDDNPFAPEPYSDGGAIYIGGQTRPAHTSLVLSHNTLANNQEPAIFNESAAITMSHNLIAGDDPLLASERDRSRATDSQPPATVSDYTLWWPALTTDIVSGTFVHSHDIVQDPRFVTAQGDAYHIDKDSGALDQGPGAGVSTDIDGNPRPMGAAFDLGADEYVDVDLAASHKRAEPESAVAGAVITYTIRLHNSGTYPATGTRLRDAIPSATSYVSGSARASSGTLTATAGSPLAWHGTISAAHTVTLTFQVTLAQSVAVLNTAVVTDASGEIHNLHAWINARRTYLPVVVRNAGVGGFGF